MTFLAIRIALILPGCPCLWLNYYSLFFSGFYSSWIFFVFLKILCERISEVKKIPYKTEQL